MARVTEYGRRRLARFGVALTIATGALFAAIGSAPAAAAVTGGWELTMY
jgi:hypothetical protein